MLCTDASLSERLPPMDSPTDKGKMRKLRTSEAESTDAVCSCGPSRSSGEASVMGVERRAWVIQVFRF